MIPFDPCGCVVDYIRRCYTTKMRLWKDDPTEYEVRWYWTCPGAKELPGVSPFRSLSTWGNNLDGSQDNVPPSGREWLREHFVPPDLGEQLLARDTEYSRGANPQQFEGKHWCGDIDAWHNGGTHGVSKPLTVLPGGGTDCCPGVNKDRVVATWSPKGRGFVVCLGTPSVFGTDNPTTPLADNPNAPWWAQFDYWVQKLEYVRSNVAAACGTAADWVPPSSYSPHYSEVGSIFGNYSTEVEQQALADQLAGIAVLWCGLPSERKQLQEVNPDAYGIIRSWIRSGGVLVVVDDWQAFTSDSEPNNELLAGVGCEERFDHGDFAPWSATELCRWDGTTERPSTGVTGIRWNPGAVFPPAPFSSESIAGDSSHTAYDLLEVGFASPYWYAHPQIFTRATEVTVTASVTAAVPFTAITVLIQVQDIFIILGTIPGTTSAGPVTYTYRPVLPITAPYPNWFGPILIAVTGSTVSQSLTIHAVTLFATGCSTDGGCGSWGSYPAACAPMNAPVPNHHPACGVRFMRSAAVHGASAALAFDPHDQSDPCISGGSAGGTSGQRSPYVRSTGGGSAGGESAIYSTYWQSTGGGSAGGESDFGIPGFSSTGGGSAGGESGQVAPYQSSTGGGSAGGESAIYSTYWQSTGGGAGGGESDFTVPGFSATGGGGAGGESGFSSPYWQSTGGGSAGGESPQG